MKIIAAVIALLVASADWFVSDHSVIISALGGAAVFAVIVFFTRKA